MGPPPAACLPCLSTRSRQAKGGPNDSDSGLGEAQRITGVWRAGPSTGGTADARVADGRTDVRSSFWTSLLHSPVASRARSPPEGTVRILGSNFAETDVKFRQEAKRRTGGGNTSNPRMYGAHLKMKSSDRNRACRLWERSRHFLAKRNETFVSVESDRRV